MKVIHTLRGHNAAKKVWLDGKLLSPQKSQKIVNHSPDGFNWGYGGSGPAQLALAVMLELTGNYEGYQDLKWALIAKIPRGDFEIEFEWPFVSPVGCPIGKFKNVAVEAHHEPTTKE